MAKILNREILQMFTLLQDYELDQGIRSGALLLIRCKDMFLFRYICWLMVVLQKESTKIG